MTQKETKKSRQTRSLRAFCLANALNSKIDPTYIQELQRQRFSKNLSLHFNCTIEIQIFNSLCTKVPHSCFRNQVVIDCGLLFCFFFGEAKKKKSKRSLFTCQILSHIIRTCFYTSVNIRAIIILLLHKKVFYVCL